MVGILYILRNMNTSKAIRFLPSNISYKSRPLSHYIPQFLQGAITAWLKEDNVSKNYWLLDPFGAVPDLALEAAHLGYNILVAVNNPITRFILELAAQPPSSNDLKAALAILASSRLRDERLEPHIQSVYTTSCQQCHQDIIAEAFLWNSGEDTPYGRIYTCPFCSNSGEYATTPKDRDQVKKFGSGGFHRMRILERVAPLHDPDRIFAEEALVVYSGRAIYVLSTLINKLVGLPISPEQQQHISALLLFAFDQATKLWPYPQKEKRPRQLSTPSKYRENNIWIALENAITLWANECEPVTISYWPDVPKEIGGICIYDGRIKDIANDLKKISIGAVVTSFPIPNQAYWTLSALWGGWLWGSEEIESFKSVLRRKNFHWRWHTSALHNTLNSLGNKLASGTPLFGVIGEADPNILTASMIAAYLSDFSLAGMAMRPEQGQIQLHWQSGNITRPLREELLTENPINEGAKAYIQIRGEPVNYIPLLGAGLETLVKSNPKFLNSTADQFYAKIQKKIRDTFSYRGGFLRLDATAQQHQSGYWWLENQKEAILSLSDRVEKFLVTMLVENMVSSFQALDQAVCTSFTGLLTPNKTLIDACLESYGQKSQIDNLWQIRPQDQPSSRNIDLKAMTDLTYILGAKLKYNTHIAGEHRFQWIDAMNQPRYTIYLTASALLGKILASKHNKNIKPLIIIPGGRANLVSYKLDHDPFLRQQLEIGWKLIKFRHWRHLAENSSLSHINFDAQLLLDPFERKDPQFQLL